MKFLTTTLIIVVLFFSNSLHTMNQEPVKLQNLETIHYTRLNASSIDETLIENMLFLFQECNNEYQTTPLSLDVESLQEDIKNGYYFIARDIALPGNNIVAFFKIQLLHDVESELFIVIPQENNGHIATNGYFEVNTLQLFNPQEGLSIKSHPHLFDDAQTTLPQLKRAPTISSFIETPLDDVSTDKKNQTHIHLDSTFTVNTRLRNQKIVSYRDQSINYYLEDLALKEIQSEIINDIRERKSQSIVFLYETNFDETINNARIRLLAQTAHTIKWHLQETPVWAQTDLLKINYQNYLANSLQALSIQLEAAA